MAKENLPKKPRGNGLKHVTIDFSRVKHITLGELYGSNPIPISDLTKKLWAIIRQHGLMVTKKTLPQIPPSTQP